MVKFYFAIRIIVSILFLVSEFMFMWLLVTHCYSFAYSKEKQKHHQLTNEIHAANNETKTFPYSFVWAHSLSKRFENGIALSQWYKVISISFPGFRDVLKAIFFLCSVRKNFSYSISISMDLNEWMHIQMQCILCMGFERPFHPTGLIQHRTGIVQLRWRLFSIRILTAWINQKFLFISQLSKYILMYALNKVQCMRQCACVQHLYFTDGLEPRIHCPTIQTFMTLFRPLFIRNFSKHRNVSHWNNENSEFLRKKSSGNFKWEKWNQNWDELEHLLSTT